MLDVHHRRLSLARQRGSPNPLLSIRKRRFSTPQSSGTPAEIRWPLISFLRRAQFDEESIALAAQSAATAPVLHQLVLHHLEAVDQKFRCLHQMCEEAKSRVGLEEMEVLYELRKQFLRAALRSSKCSGVLSDTAESLRLCLLEAVETFCRSLVRSINNTCVTHTCATPVRTPIRQLALPSATPMKTSDLLATPKRPPSPSTEHSSTVPVVGDTPLDQVKATQLNLRRVRALKDLAHQMATPVKLLAQAKLGRLSVIQEEERERESPDLGGEQKSIGGQRSIGGGGQKKVNRDFSDSPEIEDGPMKRSRSVQESPTLKKQRRKTDSGVLPLSQVSTTVEEPPPRKRASAALLGCKAAQSGKYVSRMAVTAKAKRTRERKALRNAMRENDDGEIGRNKSKRQRQAAKLAELQREKTFVIKETEDVADSYRVEETQIQTASLDEQLQDTFKLDSFRPGQREAVEGLLSATSVSLLVSLPTGLGKSLIFQMAALNLGRGRRELTIVVCPTVPLLDDQYGKAQSLLHGCVAAGLLHSNVSLEESRRVLNGLRGGHLDILFTTPEQAVSFKCVTAAAAGRQVGLLVVDEAHCLSEWGHSFRPAYQKVLLTAANCLKVPRLLLTTATASRATLESVRAHVPGDLRIINPLKASYRPDLVKSVSFVKTDALNDLVALVKKPDYVRTPGIILVYTWMKWITEKVCRRLKEEFAEEICLYYHSDLDQDEKLKVTSAFLTGKCRFLVATQALGIGMDSPWVARVIHLNIPSGLEQYIQETGRCNRSQKFTPGLCHCFVSLKDYVQRYQQVCGSMIDSVAVHTAFTQLFLSEMPVVTDKVLRSHNSDKHANSPNVELAKLTLNKSANKLLKHQGPRRIYQNSNETIKGISLRTPTKRRLPFEIRLIHISLHELALMLNVRSDDELQVILTLMDIEASHTMVKIRENDLPDDLRELKRAYNTQITPDQQQGPSPTVQSTPTQSEGQTSDGTPVNGYKETGYKESGHRESRHRESGHKDDQRPSDEPSTITDENPTQMKERSAETENRSAETELQSAETEVRSAETEIELLGSKSDGIVSDKSSPICSTEASSLLDVVLPSDPVVEFACPMIKLWSTQAEGIEIRCHERPLEELVDENPLLDFLSRFWTRGGSGGFYKLYWVDLLTSCRHQDNSCSLIPSLFIDIDVIEQSIRDVAGKLHLALRPLQAGSEKSVFFRVLSSSSSLEKQTKRVCDAIVAKLKRNNLVQVNRLDAGLVAMYIRSKLDETKFDQFIEDYFSWPPEMETTDRHTLWKSERFKEYRVNGEDEFVELLDSAFEDANLSNVIEASQLKYSVERLSTYLQTELHLTPVVKPSLRVCAKQSVFTPITLARILCGIPSARFGHTNSRHLPGWGAYRSTQFDSVLSLCRNL